MGFDINQTIANYAAEHLTGIPWNDLAKTAPIIEGKPKPLYSAQYVEQYLGPAFEAAKSVMDTLEFGDIKWDSSEALSAFSKMKNAASRVEGGVVSAIKANTLELSYEAMQFDVLTLKMYVLDVYLTALNGFNQHVGHANIARTWANEPPTLEETEERERAAMDHATLIVTMFELIVKLDKFHALDPIKKAGAQSGLGIAPALLVALVVGSVVVVALIIWGLASLVDVSQKNKILEKVCINATDTSVQKSCIEAAQKSAFQPDFGDVMSGFTKWIVLGGLVVAGVYFAPLIASKFFQTRKVVRAEAA